MKHEHLLAGFQSAEDALNEIRASGRRTLNFAAENRAELDKHKWNGKYYVCRSDKTLRGKPLYAIKITKGKTTLLETDIDGHVLRDFPDNVRWDDVL